MISPMRRGALCALMAPHSRASSATAMPISSGNSQAATKTPGNSQRAKMAASTAGISTAADATRMLRLFGSKRLASRQDVIDLGPAIAPITSAEFVHGGLQMGRSVIGPQHVLEHQLGVGRLPQQEVGQPLLSAGADDQVRRRILRRGQLGFE